MLGTYVTVKSPTSDLNEFDKLFKVFLSTSEESCFTAIEILLCYNTIEEYKLLIITSSFVVKTVKKYRKQMLRIFLRSSKVSDRGKRF